MRMIVTFPTLKKDISIAVRPVMGAGARRAATDMRRLFRAGVGGDGRSIGPNRLKQTGKLLKSVKGYPSQLRGRWIGIVGATGTRDDLGESLRGRNAGLLAVQIYGRKTWVRRNRLTGMFKLPPAVEQRAKEAMVRAIERAITKGQARLFR